MSLAPTNNRLQLPETLRAQFRDFRRRVWMIKTVEAIGTAMFGLLLSYLGVFGLDRFWDTPPSLRGIFLAAALLSCALVPLALHRWIWRYRQLEPLARLLSRKHPHIGDQLLGIIELVRSESEQARSLTLCQAAVQQVAQAAQQRDFLDAVPTPRHRMWAVLAVGLAAIALGLVAFVPAAASNAWARFLRPWQDTPRFTFAAIARLPEPLVVPHGEPFTITVQLADDTLWCPHQGHAKLGHQRPVDANLREGRYEFELPPQLDHGWLTVRIGDARQSVPIEPTLRPELTSVVAEVALPDYLGRPQPQQKDVRGGAISLVEGSRAKFTATASRKLFSAQVDGRSQPPIGATVTSLPTEVQGARKMEFRWQDETGLAGKEPFTLSITERQDEPPSLACEDLPRQKVVLDSELLAFKVRSQDDFGVRRVGLEWQGLDSTTVSTPAKGERILAAGGNDNETLELGGTFSAMSLGIEPQPVNVRIFVEDYFPGRERVYSPTYTFYVLDPQQHAIWLTDQLSKWHRLSLEVREREMQLHETNKELRALSRQELDQAETRHRIQNQAVAERTNGRRLTHLVGVGQDLVRQATRNPEIGVGHLEKWAEMLQILQDIAASRMPSVADLLKEAAQAPQVAATSPANSSPAAGQLRDAGSGASTRSPADVPKKPAVVPQVVDVESSQQPGKKPTDQPAANSSQSPASLGLPQTLLRGGDSGSASCPTGQKLDQAVTEQRDLLTEFEKLADELNRVLAQLEGSTLVKRLKAASRLQYRIGGRINDQLSKTFGMLPSHVGRIAKKVLGELAKEEAKSSHDVSLIMDDMHAYFERRRFLQFKAVLDDMKKQDAVGSLRQLGDDLQKEQGISLAQCEYWSDTLDRWAEDLVDPTQSGKCPGAKSRGSLPPSIVLEVMHILQGEVDLREETRVAEQAKPALATQEYAKQANRLSESQDVWRDRVLKVAEQIAALPDGEKEFAPEIRLLGDVSAVMLEAAYVLASPDTGVAAIGPETEAIELLLQSRRFNGRGGGGGGSIPGGGGGGSTNDPALALLGIGLNEKEVREDRGVSQTTGESGPSLPEEFRAGLDEYFNRLERGKVGE